MKASNQKTLRNSYKYSVKFWFVTFYQKSFFKVNLNLFSFKRTVKFSNKASLPLVECGQG